MANQSFRVTSSKKKVGRTEDIPLIMRFVDVNLEQEHFVGFMPVGKTSENSLQN